MGHSKEPDRTDVIKYKNYEDYIDSLLLPHDLQYIHNIEVLRQLIQYKSLR